MQNQRWYVVGLATNLVLLAACGGAPEAIETPPPGSESGGASVPSNGIQAQLEAERPRIEAALRQSGLDVDALLAEGRELAARPPSEATDAARAEYIARVKPAYDRALAVAGIALELPPQAPRAAGFDDAGKGGHAEEEVGSTASALVFSCDGSAVAPPFAGPISAGVSGGDAASGLLSGRADALFAGAPRDARGLSAVVHSPRFGALVDVSADVLVDTAAVSAFVPVFSYAGAGVALELRVFDDAGNTKCTSAPLELARLELPFGGSTVSHPRGVNRSLSCSFFRQASEPDHYQVELQLIVYATVVGLAQASAQGIVRLDQVSANTCASKNAIRGIAGKCLDAWSSTSPANGTPAAVWDCLGDTFQQWRFESDGTLRGVGGKCLDVDLASPGGWSAWNGTPIQIWDCWGGDNQRWRITPSGTIQGLNNKCLTALGPTNGQQLELWDCGAAPAGASQTWTLE